MNIREREREREETRIKQSHLRWRERNVWKMMMVRDNNDNGGRSSIVINFYLQVRWS